MLSLGSYPGILLSADGDNRVPSSGPSKNGTACLLSKIQEVEALLDDVSDGENQSNKEESGRLLCMPNPQQQHHKTSLVKPPSVLNNCYHQ
jgi:hypothetical protein